MVTHGRRETLLRRIVVAVTAFGAAVTIAVLVLYFAHFHGNLSTDTTDWGTFGDYFGGALGPLLSFLGLLAVATTLWMQIDELQASRRQSFETTLFQMLRRFDDSLNAIEVTRHIIAPQMSGPLVQTVTHTGRAAVHDIYREIKSSFSEYAIPDPSKSIEVAATVYRKVYLQYEDDLGQYFRLLYHTFRFVDRSALSADDKAIYANIVRAQLSKYELLLIFYNGTTGEGAEGFAPLINKYGLLKHVAKAELLDSKHITEPSAYSGTAFMSHSQRRKYWAMNPG